MSTLFFNTRYKQMNSLSTFTKCIDYFDREDRADKNLLSQDMSQDKDAKDMFSYYFHRKGSCGGFDFNGDKSYESIMEEYQTYRPNYVWQSIISFTREDAVEFGLKEKKDFVSLTRKVIMKMAEEKGIPLRDVAWGGFYHVNTDQPHVHFYFYNKRDPFDNVLFSSKSITKIRSTIGREVLDRSVLLKAKEDASRTVVLQMRSIINDDVFLKELENYRSQRTRESRMFIHPNFKLKSEVFKKLQALNEILPKKGRLSYNAHAMTPYKKEIDEFIELLLTQKGIKDDYQIFLKQLQEVFLSNEKLYGEGKNQQNYINDQRNRLYSSLGNAVLKMIKIYREFSFELPEFKYSQYMSKTEIRKEDLRLLRPYTYDLARYSFRLMSREISHLRHMQRIRERSQKLMLREVEKEEKDNQEQENGVKYAS